MAKARNMYQVAFFNEKIAISQKLLIQIKDARDELDILKTIILYQERVQMQLLGGKGRDTDLSHDIEEIDRRAERIQNAVSYSHDSFAPSLY